MFSIRKPQQAIGLLRSLTLPIILLLSTLLRFNHLSGQSLWADEGNSVALARRGFAEIAQRTAFDIHPPFYYWLLKIWVAIFGDNEIGLRSLSAVLGVGLVYLIWLLGKRLFSPRVGLMAAFIAALSPLQVYYSQETRMYMLLAVLSSLTVLTTVVILESYLLDNTHKLLSGLIYILTVTAGLYTHYAFPLILFAVNLIAFIWFWQKKSEIGNRKSKFVHWLSLQLVPLILYLPWLPTAWRQNTTWPSEQIIISLREILETISTTLLFGFSWPFDWGQLSIIVLGLVLLTIPWLTAYVSRLTSHANRPAISEHSFPSLLLLYLWFLLPMVFTAIIFSPAFLKFLLVATPPLTLLLAVFIESLTLTASHWKLFLPSNTTRYTIPNPHNISSTGILIGSILLLAISITSVISLYCYYTNAGYARDNYRGLVSYIKAIGKPEDAIILHAEGQQDVFNYYYERAPLLSTPAYPLPRQRPLDESATLEELQTIANKADKIYAVYWATHQADPTGLIEGWLDTHLYKAVDQWYGNVRLVSYASPQTHQEENIVPVDYQLGRHIRLTGYALSSTQLEPGDILQLALEWETDTVLPEGYTVFVQVIDQANHLVGQRDASPLTPALDWPVDEPVSDAHGIFIEPGTPPGKHRLIVGLYNSETGQRLPIIGGESLIEDQPGDSIEIAEVEIIQRVIPLPLEAFNIQVPLNTPML